MIVTVSGGWTPDKGRNELDVQVKLVGNDPADVAHLESIVGDKWEVTGVSFAGGTLTFDVKASRNVTLEEQAAIKQAAEEDAKAKAEADAKAASEAASAQADHDARLAAIAGAAAKAAVEAVKDQL